MMSVDVQVEDIGKDFLVQTFSKCFLKILTEVAVTPEAGGLFQNSTTLTENNDPLLWRWLAPWSTLKGCFLRPRRAGGRKKKVRINIQNAP